jgi:hypothetical protein
MARSASENQQLCRQSIIDNAPACLLNPEYWHLVGLRKLHIQPELRHRGGITRGYATPHGDVYLSAKGTVKFRSASPYSVPNGKSDMSPTGVLAHEVGHTVQFRLLEMRAGTLM